ncbi:MAG: SUF system Fe-S cluster assembly protein [Myxococcaceae bacterium]
MDEELLQALRTVIDPELGIDVVSLGLVYGARREGDVAKVALTMTTPACPLGEAIAADAREALLLRVPELREAEVELVFEPPWTRDRMSAEARRQLGVPEEPPP